MCTCCSLSSGFGRGSSLVRLSYHTRPSSNVDLTTLNYSFYAACMGDTLASELGMLANSKPVMITTGAETAPGTNGGITYWGTFCSAAGGLFIGIITAIDLFLEGQLCGMGILKVLCLASLSGLLGSAVSEVRQAAQFRFRRNL